MLCETARERLCVRGDGERLPDRQQYAATLHHCLTCPDCRAYRQYLKRLRQSARHLPVTLPAGLRERVLSRLPTPTADAQTAAETLTRTTRQREIAMLKRLTAITGAVLVAAVAATLTTQPLSSQTAAQTNEPRPRTPGTTHKYPVTDSILRQIQAHENAANFNKVKRLREHWHSWAMLRRNEIRQMFSASNKDQAALMHVYDELPALLPLEGEGLTEMDLLHSYGPPFAWQISADLQHKPRMNDLAVYQNFGFCRDIKIASSTSNFALQFTLWASGRVTAAISGEHYRPTPMRIGNTVYNSEGIEADSLHSERQVVRRSNYTICPIYEELTR